MDEEISDCVVCHFDWEDHFLKWPNREPQKGAPCPHSDADRILYVLRTLWNTLTPNTLHEDPRNTFTGMHVDEIRRLSKEEAGVAQLERDIYYEQVGFKRALAYVIGMLDWPSWKESVAPEATILLETYRQWTAHRQGQSYVIKQIPDLPHEIEFDREEAEAAAREHDHD